MLVLCKVLRLFVKTLSDDGKYFLLYRDNLTQPIQILFSQKPKTFSELFSTFLKCPINFAHFKKKDDPHIRCISQITVFEKGDWIYICKIPFKRTLPQKTWKRAERLLKSSQHYLYHIFQSLWI